MIQSIIRGRNSIMAKKYVIVSPAWADSGDGFADMPALFFVVPFHKLKYEQVCGYSLGHKVAFYDDLDGAKKQFPSSYNKSNDISSVFDSQNAIIELDFENNSATNFCKIYEIKGKVEQFKKCENSELFEKIILPKWLERDIRSKDLTKGALAEINRQFLLNHQGSRLSRR